MSINDPKIQHGIQSSQSKKCKILVIEDSLTVGADLQDLFEQLGHQVIVCTTAAEAHRQLSEHTFHLAVLDILLPDGDGLTLLKEIKAIPRTANLAVMILSAEAEVEDRIRGLTIGALEFIGKPYDRFHVMGRATEILNANHPESSTQPTDACETNPKSILVIDDSMTTRVKLESILKDAGFVPYLTKTGEEGIQLASRIRPDALIIDGKLPGIDGPTVVRRIRSDLDLRDTPCILLSDSNERSDEFTALEAGSDIFINKNEHPDVIIAKLNALLRDAPKASSRRRTGTLLSPKKILAIDDSPTYLTSIAQPLRDEGYDVILVSTGEEALSLLDVQHVDCILLDLTMPGLSGQQTCKNIKDSKQGKHTPIIMLTGREDREAMLESFNSGADDYIPKSDEFVVLKARVRAQLRRKQFEEENSRIREELVEKELEALAAKANQELAEQRGILLAQLESMNKELETFSYSVSHDLRAPVRRISSFTQILMDEYRDKLGPGGQEYLNRILSSCKGMLLTIEELIKLSGLSRKAIEIVPIDLSAMALEILKILKTSQETRVVELVIPEGLMANGDYGLVKILFENLLGNAWKYSSKNESSRIEFGKTFKNGKDVFFIKDNGVGFEMKYAEKLFTPFQRLHTANEFEGTGLGLAMVFRILQRHKGEIWVESAPSQGAVFYFTLASI